VEVAIAGGVVAAAASTGRCRGWGTILVVREQSWLTRSIATTGALLQQCW